MKDEPHFVRGLKDNDWGDTSFYIKDPEGFRIGASYLLDVCSRAVELFDAGSTKAEQKRYLIDFILSNATLEGEKLQFTLKEPFEAVISLSKYQKWYGILARVRTKLTIML